MKKHIYFYLILASVVLCDMGLKWAFSDADFVFIPYIINIISVQNFGALAGIFSGKVGLLIGVTAAMMVSLVLFFSITKRKSMLLVVAMAIFVGGALGNLIDRIALGYVRDFIQFGFWTNFPVFNLADIMLTMGAILLAVYIIWGDKWECKK